MTDQTLTPGSGTARAPADPDGTSRGPTATDDGRRPPAPPPPGPPAPRRTPRRRAAGRRGHRRPVPDRHRERAVVPGQRDHPGRGPRRPAPQRGRRRRRAAAGDRRPLPARWSRWRSRPRSGSSTTAAATTPRRSRSAGRCSRRSRAAWTLLHPAVEAPAPPSLHDPPAAARPRPRLRVPRHQPAHGRRGVQRRRRAGPGPAARRSGTTASPSTSGSWRAWWRPACRWSAAATTTASSSDYKSLGTEIAGKQVTYAVDGGSIDLLWFIDGDESALGRALDEGLPGTATRRTRSATATTERDARSGTRAAAPAEPTAQEPHRAQGPHARPVRADDVRRRPAQARRLEDPRRARGGRAPPRLPAHVVQGSYNHGGVSASAGTHDGGGVVDLLAWDWQRKVRALRTVGFAAWYRPPVRGLWGAHIHAVLIDHGKLAPSAARQVIAYRNGRDGLRSNLPDRFWRPSPIPVFQYPPKQRRRPDAGRRREPQPATRPAAGAVPAEADAGRGRHQPPPGRPDRPQGGAGGRAALVVPQGHRGRHDQGLDVPQAGASRPATPGSRSAPTTSPAPTPATPPRRRGSSSTNADIRAGDMLPMLDLESLEGMSLAEVTTWTGRWVHTVTRDLRRRGLVARPIIYTPFSLGNGFGCLLWVARYSDDFRAPTIPKPWRNAAIWQHSNGTVRPGQARARLRPGRRQRGAPRRPAVGAARQEGEEGVSAAGTRPPPRPRADAHRSRGRTGRSRSRSTYRSSRSRSTYPSLPEPVDVPVVPEPVDAPVAPEPVDVPVIPEPVDAPVDPPSRSTCPSSRSRPLPAPAETDVNQLIDLAVARVQLEMAQQQLEAALARLPER